MAQEERKKEDLFIKEKRRSKKFFITGSNISGGANKTTISSSVFTQISKSFSDGEHLTNKSLRGINGPMLYMMQEMEQDLDDVYNEVSASSFQASFFPFATIDSGSLGVISSSLIPDKDNKYDLGSSGKEWKDLYIDGTANVDAINLNGTAISVTAANINSVTGKLDSTGGTISGPLGNRITGFTGGDTTPSVNGGNVFVTANTKSPTSITFFDNGIEGQEITIIILDTNTTFIHNAKFMLLNGAKNITLASGDTITFVFYKNKWYEKCRSDNT